MSSKIAVIGVGGRTGTMLAFELGKSNDLFGIAEKKELELIKAKKFYVKRGEEVDLFKEMVILPEDFINNLLPDIIFLTVKNPVAPAVRYYYQKAKMMAKEENQKLPMLVLSQNGLEAGKEAITVLKEIFGKKAEQIQVVRLSLFNSVDKKENSGKIYVSYFLPVRLAFGVISGPKETTGLKNIFKEAGIEAEEVLPENVRNMEFSKLLTNLIGLPSALKNLSIKEGFENKEIFKEEIEVLREYLKVVKASNGKILNFKKMPLKLLANLISFCPLSVLFLFRKKLADEVSKGRGGKPKGNLDEIDYYNGEVVKLAKKLGIKVPTNEKILKLAKEKLNL